MNIKNYIITCGVCGEEIELSTRYDDVVECGGCGHLVCARCERKVVYESYQGLACGCNDEQLKEGINVKN